MLNVATINSDTFLFVWLCHAELLERFPAYLDVYNCYLYSCHKISLCLHLNDAFGQQMDWTRRFNSLVSSITSPGTIGFPFLGVHENPGVRDSRGDTTQVTAHSPTLPLLYLRHSSFSNPSFASLTSQALHLKHLASLPWFFHAPSNQCNLLFIFCFFTRETIKFDRNN